ncbi:unnamed protein product, partial [Mesorhabditis spiculigera]
MSSEESTVLGFPEYPKFQRNQPRFPQETFLGRYLHYLDVVDPRTLLTSDSRLKECVELLKAYDAGEKNLASDRELWEAQKIKGAILHPDTGEKVLPPFRMSGYVPFGWITVTGMLLPNPSNASQPQPISKFVGAYLAAVTSACSIAGGLTYMIKKAGSLPPATRLIIQRFVPLPATSLASHTGIEVYDREGTVIGVSKVAVKQAVTDTALTRAFLPVPLLALPPCIMPFFEKFRWVQKSATRHLLVNAIVCTISFGISLPIALALFPQESTISVNQLEPEFREKTRATELYYNKGL